MVGVKFPLRRQSLERELIMKSAFAFKSGTGIALALVALMPAAAWADPTAPCNDSAIGGTECGTNSTAGSYATAVGNTASAT